MPTLYHIRAGEREFGPATLEMLKEWKEEGRIGRQTPVRVEGARDWFDAENIAALYPDHPDQEVPDAHKPPPLPVDHAAGTLFSRLFQLYARNFWTYFFIALPLFPALLAITISGQIHPLTSARPTLWEYVETLRPTVLPTIIQQLIWPLVTGALVVAAGKAIDGGTPTFSEAWRGIRGKKRTLTGAYLLSMFLYIATFVPSVALTIATDDSKDNLPRAALLGMLTLIMLTISLFMASRICVDLMVRNQAVIFEGEKVRGAMARSRFLMRLPAGNSWSQRPGWVGSLVYVLWMLMSMGGGILAALPIIGHAMGRVAAGADPIQAMALPMMHPLSMVSYFLSALAGCAVLPILPIGFTLLYRRLIQEEARLED